MGWRMTAKRLRFSLVILAFGMMSTAFSQEMLTLDRALMLAKDGNGDVRAAFFNYRSAQASARGSYAAFLPAITPTFSIESGQSEVLTGPFRGTSRGSTNGAAIDVTWRLFDNGTRQDNYRRAMLSASTSELNALQTLRSTLFSVHTRFFDALRAQELLRVQQENLKRAAVILEQTKIRANPPIEDLPRKNILQAEADYQNARVSVLTAENRVQSSEANLKEVLAWDAEELPELVQPTLQQLPPLEFTLQEAVLRGLENRADLAATRKRVESQILAVRTARRDAFLQYSVDANYRKVFAEDPFQRAALTFSATLPLYDGDRSKSLTQAEQFTLESLEASLEQTERVARAEIEATYKEYGQNRVRYDAATAALVAARVNYEAAVESQREGAGNLIEVLTAQVSLTTAESNLVEATYDLLISNVRLQLVTGQPMPGE